MLIVDFIRSFRDKQEPSIKDLHEFIQSVAEDTVADYQISAWLMAIFLNGISTNMRSELTLAMRDSGHVMSWQDVPGKMIDKHSTGGVGDKISIPLAPLVAACGVKVPMISGRGLGHTGGTLDKLESIPGFNVNISTEQFKQLVYTHGLGLAGQTKDLAPADKKLYALRDVTATVESIDLIAPSIMSKKLAEGIDGLALDVKVGSGAFMKDLSHARQLAQALIEIGQHAGVTVTALLTSMEQPLGNYVGNALEIKESIDILNGQGPQDSTELTIELGATMLMLGKITNDLQQARSMIQQAIDSGQGLKKFKDIIAAQNGNPEVVDNPSLLPTATFTSSIAAPQSGYISAINTQQIGMAALMLGAGRRKAEDPIDPSVGFHIHKKIGDCVEQGEPIATVYHNNQEKFLQAQQTYLQALSFSESLPPSIPPLVIEQLTSQT